MPAVPCPVPQYLMFLEPECSPSESKNVFALQPWTEIPGNELPLGIFPYECKIVGSKGISVQNIALAYPEAFGWLCRLCRHSIVAIIRSVDRMWRRGRFIEPGAVPDTVRYSVDTVAGSEMSPEGPPFAQSHFRTQMQA